MGCGHSTNSAVHPLTEVNRDEDETGSKPGGRGDSAVSKVTTDSGVVMENRGTLVLPEAASDVLPARTSESIRESEVDRATQHAADPGVLQQDGPVQERPKSSEILKELLTQGIIPVGQSRDGAAYNIVLDGREGFVRRPPARLESLQAKKGQSLLSRQEIDEKMRLTEERRKFKEDELKTRLRTKSARVRGHAPVSSIDEDAFLTPVESLQSHLTPNPTSALKLRSQIPREPAEGGEWVREARCDGRECREEVRGTGKTGEGEGEHVDQRGKVVKDGEKEEEEEVTTVEELKADELLKSLGELESDSSFQCAENKEEIF
ncbi:uncharacterized protein stmnd1 [Odontesthes bonariensis]|uniref:uncharacterized protein stmnd1 n=1 Tax=Odontesthes bonariensis TaxID=219752 RepID=UPI003F585C07